MAKKPATSHTPPMKPDASLQAIADSIITTMKPFVAAQGLAAKAKSDIASTGEASIRAMVATLHGINRSLDTDAIDTLAGLITDGLGYQGKSANSRKSEYRTLIEARQKLPGILQGVEKLQTRALAKDPKASFNIRQQTLTAARIAKKDSDKTTAEILRDLERRLPIFGPEPTRQSKARALTDRLREAEALHVQVGDESMLDEAADKLLTGLETLIDGETPLILEELASLRDRVAELESELSQLTETATAQAEELELTEPTTSEAEIAASDENTALSEAPAAIPTLSSPAPLAAGTKSTSLSESLTGYSFDELLNLPTSQKRT